MTIFSTRMRSAVGLASVVLACTLTLGGCARDTGEPSVVPPAQPAPDNGQAPADAPSLAGLDVTLETVWSGLEQPLYVTHAADGSGRVFILEKAGRVRVVERGRLLDRPYFDISALVSTGGEQGLLGLAFAPDFAESGRFYINYTDRTGATVIARYSADDPASPEIGPAAGEVVLRIDQPYANHNGGCIKFGPDGYLYIGMGDGGSGGDPQGFGQATDTLLGKMLRIDTGDSPQGALAESTAYTIPADNPFAGDAGTRDEIWALGLRNPWRFSFDRETGDLWIADVGQSSREEVNFQPADSGGGENYGWNLYEGTMAFPEGRDTSSDPEDLVMPVIEYEHPVGRSITGGYVYRGESYPDLAGVYVYGDYVTGRVWGFVNRGADSESAMLIETGANISSFGEDESGELYVCDMQGGTVSRVQLR